MKHKSLHWCKTLVLVALATLLMQGAACDGTKPPATELLPPAGPIVTPGGPAGSNQDPETEVPATTPKAEAAPNAILNQAKNGPSVVPLTPTWVAGEVSEFDSHYMEGHSIPFRIVMSDLPVDGTAVEVVLGYDVKHGGKHAIAFLTHYQRLEPHSHALGHGAEVVNPLDGVENVPTVADSLPIPPPRGSIEIDCLPGNRMQPQSSFAALSAGERVMSLFGGDLTTIAYDGAVPDLSQENAREHIKVTFTPTSKTAVLAWGGHIASQDDFGCSANDVRTARGMLDSPYMVELVSWNLADVTTQQSMLRGLGVIDPDLYCFVDGPLSVCPNETEVSYTVNIEGDCEEPFFVQWVVLGDAEIIGSDGEPTVQVQPESFGTFLVFATAFCADCSGCVPLFCCKIVEVVIPPEADAGPDDSSCPADSGPTCFQLAGTGINGTPTWSVTSQPSSDPACNVTITNGNGFTPTACFPEGCSGTATIQISVEGQCGTAVDDVVLTVNPDSTADAGSDEIACVAVADPTCFTLSGSGTNGDPTWTIVNEPSAGSVTITGGNTFTPTACFAAGVTGSTTLRLSVAGNPPCPASDDVVLTVVERPTADAGEGETLCVAPTGQTCFQLEGSGTNGTPSWSVVTQTGSLGCDVVITNGNTFTPSVCIPEGCTGTVVIELTVTGATECPSATDSVELTVVPGSTADAGPDEEACPAIDGATCFTLNGSGSGGASSWSVISEPSPGTVTIIAGNTFTPTVCFDEGVLGSATIRLNVGGISPCPDATDDVTLTVGPSDLACTIDAPSTAGLFTGSITGGTAPYTCEAEFDSAGWFVTDCIVNGNTLEVIYTRDGGICTPIPTVTVTIIDAEGCTTECFVEIPCPQGCTVPSKIACDCPHNPITICAMASGGLPPFDFNWTGPMGSSNMMCLMVDTPGIYTSTVTDGNGLSETCCSAVVNSMISGPSPCPQETGLTYEVNFELPEGTFTPSSYSWSISGNGSFCGPTDGSSVCVDAGASGVFTLVVVANGTATFECEGTVQTVPVTGTCALAYVVELKNCGGGD